MESKLFPLRILLITGFFHFFPAFYAGIDDKLVFSESRSPPGCAVSAIFLATVVTFNELFPEEGFFLSAALTHHETDSFNRFYMIAEIFKC
jgi:hypothetical protein